MRALLVGAGGMGRAWARNLLSSADATLVGWIDIVPGAACSAASELGLAAEYTGTELDAAIDGCSPDFVVDVTPPEVHHEITTRALLRGLPVLGEKPMAATMEQAREMVRASEEAGKLYMVSQSRRYNRHLGSFRELIGEIAPLGLLTADFFIGAHFGGFRDEMPSPLLLDMAIHTFDAARFLSRADPVSVYAESFNPRWSWYEGDACAAALFEMSDGSRFHYRGSWCAEGCHTSWESDWRAVGERGTSLWDGNAQPHAERVVNASGFHSECEQLQGPEVEMSEGIAGSLREFIESLQTGVSPQGECHDNIKSFAMVMAAYESTRLGKRVRVDC